MTGLDEPLVSIIVNCYNSDKYLKETLDSIISQTYLNWEVIFWDNQSTDQSASYLHSYQEPRFKYFYAPSFETLSTARNLAIEKANGEFIAFLDADDVWSPEKLALQIPHFSNTNVGLVYSDFEIILESNMKSALAMYHSFSRMGLGPHESTNIYNQLLNANFIIFSTVVVRKTIFLLTGGFTKEFKHNEDYEILLKVSLHSDAVGIETKTTKYRIHGGNNSYENNLLSYVEINKILESFPISKDVNKAKNINNARHHLAKIANGQKELIWELITKKQLFLGIIGLAKRKVNTLFFKQRKLR